ncbi:MAG: VanZ family protein [Vicinamibacterales bacterium]
MAGARGAWWLWGPVALYMAIIFALSAMPEPPAPPGVDDKTQHFLAYAGLGLVTLRATAGGTLSGLGPGPAMAAWAITTLYGASDEFHQRFVPGRSADLLDLRADALGAAGAIAAASLFGILRRSRAAFRP